ncbi:type 1 glutamine amidotransferase domain-containing protein [Permianibacter sp. IMCC34836]|uniref:type 1 glutamine amidotransferase domain-containing protein n=1 Tax=Permianibacter fluminis TaxID=2738515 RepID=UPI001552B41B|nr:type 1 glutamine amidotransferase domain-containing protein [Permianibacter fluminis]NQD36714.1 type 1 glutamine amidotransferase domain-containing protein [Permianibacter fluminis]
MKPVHLLLVVTSASRMSTGKATGLWLEEFAVPYLQFRQSAVRLTVASPAGGAAPIDPASAAELDAHPEWQPAVAALAHTDVLSNVHASQFDAVFIPGGHGCMFDLATSSAMSRLLREFFQQKKMIAAVCHGPAALVNARDDNELPLVHGKRLTAFTNAEERAVALDTSMPFLLESQLRECGARFVAAENFQAHVVRDGWLITGQNPASSAVTATLLLQALAVH